MNTGERNDKLGELAGKLSLLADEAMHAGDVLSPADIRSLSTALVNIGKLQGGDEKKNTGEIKVVFVGNDWDVR